MRYYKIMAKRKIRKQILRYGSWFHPKAPGGTLKVDKKFARQLIANFEKTPFVPVFRGHQKNSDVEKDTNLMLAKNIIGIDYNEEGIHAEFEAEEDELEKYNDVSASIDPNYEDHETGRNIGAVVKHIAFVLDPFIKGLKPFVPLQESQEDYLIYLSDIQTMDETKDTPIEEVVEESTEEVVEPVEEVVEPTETPEETIEEVEEPTEDPVDEDEVNASDDLKDTVRKQQIEIDSLKRGAFLREAESKCETLLSEGKILPKQKDIVAKLLMASDKEINLADGETTTVETLLSEFFDSAPSLINLAERGVIAEKDNSPIPKAHRDSLQKTMNLSDEEMEVFLSDSKNRDIVRRSIEKYT